MSGGQKRCVCTLAALLLPLLAHGWLAAPLQCSHRCSLLGAGPLRCSHRLSFARRPVVFASEEAAPAEEANEVTRMLQREMWKALSGLGSDESCEELTDEVLRTSFDALDLDGSGRISSEELLESIMRGFGNSKEPELAARQMIEAADADGDGFIDFGEFKAILRDACEV